MWRDSKRAANCKPRREASKETNTAYTLFLDFQPPGLWKNKFLLFVTQLVVFYYGSPSELTQWCMPKTLGMYYAFNRYFHLLLYTLCPLVWQLACSRHVNRSSQMNDWKSLLSFWNIFLIKHLENGSSFCFCETLLILLFKVWVIYPLTEYET